MNMEMIMLEKKELFSYLRKIAKKDYLHLSVLGWHDMDYFPELCMENGGCSEEVLSIFNSLPLSEKIFFNEFKCFLKVFIKHPVLESYNKEIKFNYDFHIWTKKYYLIYNLRFEILIIKKMNFLEKIFKNTIVPYWQKE